jgi:hypothetical protein
MIMEDSEGHNTTIDPSQLNSTLFTVYYAPKIANFSFTPSGINSPAISHFFPVKDISTVSIISLRILFSDFDNNIILADVTLTSLLNTSNTMTGTVTSYIGRYNALP